MKRAVIMGATSGMGQEVASILAGKGWKIGVAGRREEKLKEAARKAAKEAEKAAKRAAKEAQQ